MPPICQGKSGFQIELTTGNHAVLHVYVYCVMFCTCILSFGYIVCRDRDRDRRSPKRDYSSRSRMRSDEIEEKRKRLRSKSDEGEPKQKSLTSRSKKKEQEERLTADVKIKEEPSDNYEERELNFFNLFPFTIITIFASFKKHGFPPLTFQMRVN